MKRQVVSIAFVMLFAGVVSGCRHARTSLRTKAKGSEPEQQVFIDLTTVRIPESKFEQAMGDFRPTGTPTPVSKSRGESLVGTWSQMPDVHTVSAPKILTLPDQLVTVFVGESIRFSRTQAVTNEAGGLEFSIKESPASPVSLGTQFRVTATLVEGGEHVNLDLHGVWRQVKPSYDPQRHLAGLDAATFRRDWTYEQRLYRAFKMENGGSAIVCSGIEEDAEGRHYRVTPVRVVVLTD